MMCPIIKKELPEKGNSCKNSGCWYWHPKAKCNCSVFDTGSDHLLESDISRIYSEDPETTSDRVDRGRRKIQAWLNLLGRLEDVEGGCKKCGSSKCHSEESCSRRVQYISKLKGLLPVNAVLHMDSPKWYSLAQAKKDSHLAFTINTKGISK